MCLSAVLNYLKITRDLIGFMIYKPLINFCTDIIYVFNLTDIVHKKVQIYF